MTSRWLVLAAALTACDTTPPKEESPETTDTEPEGCLVVDVGAIQDGGTLPAGCHLLNEDLEVHGVVVLEDGVQLLVAANVWIDIQPTGTLDARGDTLGVVIEGQAGSAWSGMLVEGTAMLNETSVHSGCSTEYGGVFSAIHLLTDATLTGTGLAVSGCSAQGITNHGDNAVLELADLSVSDAAIAAFITLPQATGLSGELSLTGAVQLDRAVFSGVGTLPPLTYDFTTYDPLIEGKLTLEAGVELRMHEDSEFRVTSTGQLLCQGTDEAQVVIRGTEGDRGFWHGMTIQSDAQAPSQLEYTTILNGGAPTTGLDYTHAGLHLDGGAANLSNVTLANHAGYALSLELESPSGSTLSDLTLHDSDRSVAATVPASGLLDNSMEFVGNDELKVQLIPRFPTVSSDLVWSVSSIPYVVNEVVDVEAQLTIQPGVYVQFTEDTGIDVQELGSLQVGGPSLPVLMSGEEVTNDAGHWLGIRLGNAEAHTLTNVLLSDAGGGWNNADRSMASIYLEDASVVLTDVTVNNSTIHDVYADGISTVTCTNVTATVEGGIDATLCE